MRKRFITSIFIVLVTVLAVLSKLLPHRIGDYIFDIFIVGIMFVASLEMSNIMNAMNKKNNVIMAASYSVLFYFVLIMSMNKLSVSEILLLELCALALYYVVSLVVELVKNKDKSGGESARVAYNTILTCMYPSFWLGLILMINHIEYFEVNIKHFSLMFIVLILAITWLTDTMAYLVGSRLKGPKLAPKISPNKTISGSIGGLIGGIGGALLVYLIIVKVPSLQLIVNQFSLDWWHFAIMGVLGSVFGQIGDLFESKLKRLANIKDSGNIFPGHGGMMDRVDAMIFVTAVVFVSLILII